VRSSTKSPVESTETCSILTLCNKTVGFFFFEVSLLYIWSPSTVFNLYLLIGISFALQEILGNVHTFWWSQLVWCACCCNLWGEARDVVSILPCTGQASQQGILQPRCQWWQRWGTLP
jgi:hypothetical protein